MFKKLKKRLEKFRISDSEYNSVKDRISENNRNNIIFLCSVCVAVFSVLTLLSIFDIGAEKKDAPVFAAALLYSIGILLFAAIKKAPSYATTMIASYLTMGAVVFYGLVISYRSPEQYTVVFIAMMCVLSMTFVDRPIRIGAAHIFATAVCIAMICFHKSNAIMVADLINVISLSAFAFLGGFVTVNAKVHGYLMDKVNEENMEKDKKRLNAMEIEALQLLTAVKSTHDMIVSVNLTENTYRLIGDESFVTQGDAIEGSFDEVIEAHAAKVTAEHRGLYRNTFSRQGLLDAYAAGKKEVYLEYQQCDDNGVPHWLGTHTMFLADPHGTDITEITISQNIDERVRRDEETKAILESERDRAEQAQKAKTDFLFQMSHDIRTPMNAILGFANFIKSSDDMYRIHNEYIPKLETAGQQLLLLINDALEMSRIESGKLEFHREIQDIRLIVGNVMSVMQIQAEDKGVEMVSDFSVMHPTVNCDQNHMSRVIMNLLSNAVKFTPMGGKVTVTLRELDESPQGYTALELKIADTGIGMSPGFIKKAFEPFEREQNSTVSGMQGTGLGLSIVKRIVETAGDTISVESKLGEGSVFTLNMTLLRAEERELEEGNAQKEAFPPKELMSTYFKGKRILLVEDNEFNLTIAQVLLENAGFTVESATDGRTAVSKVQNAPTSNYYDAILMDVQMPIMNGYEATAAIRALPDERSKTAILALTANAFDADKMNAIAAGMNGHISKPIDVVILYKALWSIFEE